MRLKWICVIMSVVSLIVLNATPVIQAMERADAHWYSGASHGQPPLALACCDLVIATSILPQVSSSLMDRETTMFTSHQVFSTADHVPFAQSDIPQVLTPSIEPSPELPVLSPSPAPTLSNSTISNTTTIAPIAKQTSPGLDKVISSISPFMVLALIPLLLIIAALFYSLFKSEHE